MSHKPQGLCTQPLGQLDPQATGATWLSHGLQPELGTETHTWGKTVLALGRQKTAIKSTPPPHLGSVQTNGIFQCVHSKHWLLTVFYCHR